LWGFGNVGVSLGAKRVWGVDGGHARLKKRGRRDV